MQDNQWFDKKMTVGNLIVIFTMLVGFGSNYALTNAQVQQNSIAIAEGLKRDDIFRNKLYELQLSEQIAQEKLRVEIAAGRETAQTAQAIITQRIAVLETKIEQVRMDLNRLVQGDRR